MQIVDICSWHLLILLYTSCRVCEYAGHYTGSCTFFEWHVVAGHICQVTYIWPVQWLMQTLQTVQHTSWLDTVSRIQWSVPQWSVRSIRSGGMRGRLTHYTRLSIDDGSTVNNSTNLGLKAIFGIKAMSEISRLLGKESDFQQFNVWQTFFITWQDVDYLTEDSCVIHGCMGSYCIIIQKQHCAAYIWSTDRRWMGVAIQYIPADVVWFQANEPASAYFCGCTRAALSYLHRFSIK